MGRESRKSYGHRSNHKQRREKGLLGPVQQVKEKLSANSNSKVNPNGSYGRFRLRVRAPLDFQQRQAIQDLLRGKDYPFTYFTEPRPGSILVLGLMEKPHMDDPALEQMTA
jgi:hypothetical protein